MMRPLTADSRMRFVACVAVTLSASSSLPRLAIAQNAPTAPASSTVQAAPDISGLTISAEQVSQALRSINAKKVAVFDFINPDETGWERVGSTLAEQFRVDLDTTSHTFVQVKHNKINEWMNRDHVQPRDLAIADVAAFAIRSSKVDGFVLGFLKPNANGTTLKLTLSVYDPKKGTPTLMATTILLTPELAALKEPGTRIDSTYPVAGASGYSAVECSLCPPAEFTQEAKDRQFNGMVVLIVVVESDGRAGQIVVKKDAPFGLTAAAIATVRGWHFKPAHDASGKPVAVRQTVEVVFHLY
jgi:hypothetical protein